MELKEALQNSRVVFSAVATPMGEHHHADLRAVFAVAESIASLAEQDLILVIKSTVPVGTGKQCEEKMNAVLKKRKVSVKIPVISNPEFLREGMAVNDTLMPDRIVIGIDGGALQARDANGKADRLHAARERGDREVREQCVPGDEDQLREYAHGTLREDRRKYSGCRARHGPR
jgi:hypothetical protein